MGRTAPPVPVGVPQRASFRSERRRRGRSTG